jgi:DNA-binding transcriptional LysR family regulator
VEPLIVPSRRALIEDIYRWFRETRSEPNIICEMDSYLDAAALAGNGMGISIFPQTAYVPNAYLSSKKIASGKRKIEYRVGRLKGHPLPNVEEERIDFVRSHSKYKKNN